MIIPNYINSKIVDEEGQATPDWANLLIQLITQLQLNLGNEGYVLPQLTGAQISALTGAQSIGAVVYNTTTGLPMVNCAGVWKTFTVT